MKVDDKVKRVAHEWLVAQRAVEAAEAALKQANRDMEAAETVRNAASEQLVRVAPVGRNIPVRMLLVETSHSLAAIIRVQHNVPNHAGQDSATVSLVTAECAL